MTPSIVQQAPTNGAHDAAPIRGAGSQAAQRLLTGVEADAYKVCQHSGLAIDCIDLALPIDRASDQLLRESMERLRRGRLAATRSDALMVLADVLPLLERIAELDQVEGELWGKQARARVVLAREGGRAIAGAVEQALTCSQCGRAACRCRASAS